MGFQVARKHAQKLRRIALMAAFVIPAILLATMLLGNSTVSIVSSTLAVLIGGAGILVERWLFFAEARHTVGLYYGADSA
jgi:DMSO reductase anchor subunit